VEEADADTVCADLKAAGEAPVVIGRLAPA